MAIAICSYQLISSLTLIGFITSLFRTKSQRWLRSIRSHVHVFLTREFALAGLKGRHIKREIPENRRHKTSHPYWSSMWKFPRLVSWVSYVMTFFHVYLCYNTVLLEWFSTILFKFVSLIWELLQKKHKYFRGLVHC